MNARFFPFTIAFLGALLVMSTLAFVASCAVAPPEPRDIVVGRDVERTPPAEEIVVTAARRERSERGAVVLGDAPATSLPRMTVPSLAAQRAFAFDAHSMADGELPPLGAGEELWIIATPAGAATQAPGAEAAPGSGAMLARLPASDDQGEPEEIPLPLKHTDVHAAINGYISTVDVTQQFENPYGEKIEVVYVFPLPEKAAVSEFLMVIGERRIRGILREKEEAAAIYAEARSQGYQASLLVQHRPNVFEQKVANIEPGREIDVQIRYFHALAYVDGWYSFAFPTVVGPRYNPPGYPDPIVPVPRGTHSAAPGLSVPYLRPNERSTHDLSIEVTIDAGVPIEELRASQEIVTAHTTDDNVTVSLARGGMIPNRDFVLDFRVAGEQIKSNLLTYRDPETRQGYFTLVLYPPAGADTLARQPMEMVFVLDCSGSMRGRPLEQAKAAVATALDHLQPGDTFQIIRFSDTASRFGNMPAPATTENLRRARRYLASLDGGGGTQMIEGIKAALDFPHDRARLRFVSFLTDGYIGNETDIIAAVHERIAASRIFSFGVGSAVNRYLLERMAKEGRGAVAYLGPDDSAADLMETFFERISHPALTDVQVDWGGMAVSDVYPAQLPDLFVGRAVVVTGRFRGTPTGVNVSGFAGGIGHTFAIAADAAGDGHAYVAKIWARLRIADLADRQAWSADPNGELANEIRRTALAHQLMSAYTSFVAVDASRITDGAYGITVEQPLPVPDGVRYDTTVGPRLQPIGVPGDPIVEPLAEEN